MMQLKSAKLLFIIVMIISSVLLISGCGKSGNRFANQPPTIQITSFEGWDTTYVNAGYDTTMVYSFQQRIYWHATDPDGVITGYAFRILDENNNPVPTPGYEYIDLTGELTPDNLLALGTGWVIHYMTGADQNIPLDDPQARRSIWTSQKYAVINFPSADSIGNPIVKFSKFEVVAIDNRGAITPHPAWRNFRTQSDRPKCMISSTKGNPNGKDVGSGLKLAFTMSDTDPFITAVPYKYEFKIMKITNQGNVIPGTESDWFSTTSEDNRTNRINEYLLTKYTNPPLSYDYDEVTLAFKNQRTKIISRVTDMAGVISIPDTASTMIFSVRPGFRPHTFIYPTKTYALTNNHFEDYGDDTTEEIKVIPRVVTEGVTRYALPLFKDFEGKYTAVYSTNIKLWIRWGWWGEYGETRGETVTYGDTIKIKTTPYNKKVDVVLDSQTGQNYFSEITAFDLRLDGEPYNYPPYPFSKYGFTDQNGKKWLRLPVNSPLGQTVVLTAGQLPLPPATEPGEHKFEVRVVDLQDEYDPTPVDFTFYLHRYIEPANRQGVLIIDDDPVSAQVNDALITQRYQAMLEGYNGNVNVITRTENNEDIRQRAIAFSDLQKYKLVIYHTDNYEKTGNLQLDFDAYSLFLMRGGNLLISHTSLLGAQLTEIANGGLRKTFVTNLGFNKIPKVSYLNNSNSPFFQKAVSNMTDYNDLNLHYDVTGSPAIHPLIDLRDGLGYLSYFENGNFSGDIFYKFGCKPTTYPTYPPTSEQFDKYNGKTVAFRRTTSSNGKVYVFGFPLSFMKVEDTRPMMNKIISELM